MDKSLNQKIFSGLFWKFGERIIAQLISLIVSILLARLLEPTDFGAVALVMVFITIANVFVSNGLGSALIQKKDADNLDFSSIFYLNIIFSIAIYVFIFIVAPYISKFYGMPILCSALRILGIRIIVAAINSVQQAYVSRNMLFKRFFWSTLFGTLISGILGVYLAFKGYGIWALIAQYLTNTCTDTIVLWFTVRWRPDLKFSFQRTVYLVHYGWKLLVSALLDTGYKQIRSIIIGKIYTPEDLAYYNQGERFPSLIVTNINTSISAVLFPALSKEQDDLVRIKQMTRRAIQVSSYIMWPLMIGLAVIAEPVIKIVLTEKWLFCVPFIRVFCFSYGLWPIHTANLQALNAMGRTDLFLKMEIIKKTLGMIVLFITANISPWAIALGLIVTDIFGSIVNAYPNSRILKYNYVEQVKDLIIPFIIAFIMGSLIYFIVLFKLSQEITILMQIVFGVCIYCGLSVILKPSGYKYLISFIYNNINRK